MTLKVRYRIKSGGRSGMTISLCSPQMATMGFAAGDSDLAKVFANRFDRLAIQVAETVDTVARANGQSTEEFPKLIEARGHGDLRMHRIGNASARTRRIECTSVDLKPS
jgi:hypothetical protein